MAYNEALVNKVREAFMDLPQVEEKAMFGGICFMVDDKMCICVKDSHLMCRVGPDEAETAVEKNGVSQMNHGGRIMKGYIYVEEPAYQRPADFDHWIEVSLSFNKVAKASKK